MHIHFSQYNYILHVFPDVTVKSTRHKVILNGLREMASELQVISHDQSVMSMFNGLKWQEMHNIHLLFKKNSC